MLLLLVLYLSTPRHCLATNTADISTSLFIGLETPEFFHLPSTQDDPWMTCDLDPYTPYPVADGLVLGASSTFFIFEEKNDVPILVCGGGALPDFQVTDKCFSLDIGHEDGWKEFTPMPYPVIRPGAAKFGNEKNE